MTSETKSARSATQGVFTIERAFAASPARVFAAFATPEGKSRWFSGSDEWTLLHREMDFSVGGRERLEGRWPSGKVSAFNSIYFDIAPNERIIHCYDMHVDGVLISVSLATIEMRPQGAGTRLTYTEQGMFLDGYDDNGSREHGARFLLDRLEASLATVDA